nr:MAG TPA: hypothetical protein [Caudoviricetes sp.]
MKFHSGSPTTHATVAISIEPGKNSSHLSGFIGPAVSGYNYLPGATALFWISPLYPCPSPADPPRGQMSQIGCRWIARFLVSTVDGFASLCCWQPC